MVRYGVGVGALRGAAGAAAYGLWWVLVFMVEDPVAPGGAGGHYGSAASLVAGVLHILLLVVMIAAPIGAVLGGVLGLVCVPVARACEPRTAAWLCGVPVAVLMVLGLPRWSLQGGPAGALELVLFGIVPGVLCGAVAAWHARDLSQRWFG